MRAYETFETPLGPFTVLVNGDGALEAAAFGELESVPGVSRDAAPATDKALTADARRQVEEYFEGGRLRFDLPLASAATPFQERYRTAMASLGLGSTTSYGALARELGTSARATGRANATNPLCLIVPCHRVIGSDGSLTGYAYGTDIKLELLAHEQRVAHRLASA